MIYIPLVLLGLFAAFLVTAAFCQSAKNRDALDNYFRDDDDSN